MAGYRRQELNRTVFVWMKDSNMPLVYVDVITYEKGSFFCIYDGSKVYKYPVANIWRVEDKRSTYAEPN